MWTVKEAWKKNLDKAWLVGLVVIDEISKILARQSGNFVTNGGVGWGIGLGGMGLWLVLGVVVVGLIKFADKWWEKLLLAGGIANLIDRLGNGAVTDFINLRGLWINLADIMISVAVVGAIISYINENKNSLRK